MMPSALTLQTILDIRTIDAERPDAVFAHFLQAGTVTTISRRDLWRGAARHAHLLRSRGVQRGDVVLILLRHSPELVSAFLGAMLMGAVPSFMPPSSPKQDPQLYWRSHTQLFERIRDGAVVASRDDLAALTQNIPRLTLRLVDVTHVASHPPLDESVATSADQVAFLQHSSGTTGLKKGVALSHQAVLRQVRSYSEAIGLRSDDCIVTWLPLYHDMGLIACFLLPLLTGTPVVMIDPFEWVVKPRILFDAIRQYRGTLCWQPNFAFQHLGRTVRPSAELDLSSMRMWTDCSEPCRAETLEGFARSFASAGVKPEQLQVCYAMAETVFAVTQTTPGRVPTVLRSEPEARRSEGRIVVATSGPQESFLSVGRVVSGLQVRIVDDVGRELPEDRVGVVSIAGDFLFEGYYKFAAETQRKLLDGWYHTGDLGFLHAGELYITGRANDLIIVHGKNFHAHELEHLVNSVPGAHPGRNVAVGWFRPEVGSEEVVIIAEVSPGAEVDRRALAQTIKQQLLDQTGLTVFDVHVVNPGWLVKTTSGKISRGENLGRYLAEVGRAAAA